MGYIVSFVLFYICFCPLVSFLSVCILMYKVLPHI
jgi:hypothetical protein